MTKKLQNKPIYLVQPDANSTKFAQGISKSDLKALEQLRVEKSVLPQESNSSLDKVSDKVTNNKQDKKMNKTAPSNYV
jgi:hypothetical protein